MANNFREYHNIKFFRGKKRNNAEMQRLADAGMDFEYRRLLIEENELDLHVAFSRTLVWKWLSWSFLALTVCFINLPIMFLTLIGLASLSQLLSIKNKRFFQFIFRSHILALSVVDAVIYKEYGISFSN